MNRILKNDGTLFAFDTDKTKKELLIEAIENKEDITDLNLSKMDLRGVDFSEQDLSRTDFTGSDLRGCNFESANIYLTQTLSARVDNDSVFDYTMIIPSARVPSPSVSIDDATPFFQMDDLQEGR